MVFLEFLRSLGFREWTGNGIDKPALDELRCQAKQRGFNSLPLNCNITSIDEEQTNSFSIYPNPATSIVYFNTTEPLQVKVYNGLGEVVIDKQVNNKELNVSSLTNGIYILQVNNSKSIRFVKE